MSSATIVAFMLFSFVAAITPGPNNLMVMTSGVNYGFRATLPHLLGICIGFPVMVLAIGLGLGEAFTRVPLLYTILKWGGIAYLLYLAWCIARTTPPTGSDSNDKPRQVMGFWNAAAFQWINPKAWMMALSAFSTYAPPASGFGVTLAIVLTWGAMSFPCVGAWALFGAKMRHVLREPRAFKIFNYSMAALLVASLLPLLRS
jgi:threonine/homoserine/homoserine lactone efflux protein